MIEQILEFDRQLFLVINENQLPRLDTVMLFLSETWVWIPLYVFLVALLVKKYGPMAVYHVLILLLIFACTDLISSQLLKPLTGRLRPCHDPLISDFVSVVGKCGGNYSFPSGHAANTMGLAIALYFLHSKWMGIPLIVWSIAIGYSRIYLGVHYPIDVTGGFLLGILTAAMVYFVSKKFLRVG